MKRAQLLDPKNEAVYIIATRSHDWLGRTIRALSGLRSKHPEFDHIIIAHRGMEYNMAFPRMKHRPLEFRPESHVYKLDIGVDPFGVLAFADRAVSRRWRYATWQVLTKAFTMLFGLNPIRARMDCIEFTINAVLSGRPSLQPPKGIDRLTVWQGVNWLETQGLIRPLAVFKNH